MVTVFGSTPTSRLKKTMADPRTPKLVIDQAIRENRRPEFLCYCFAMLFVLAGLFSLVWGAVNLDGFVALCGTVASVFFYPALAAARSIREDNMAIRMLEVALDKASTTEEAARALSDAFTRLFVERKMK
jgi:hypothetical protein